MKDDFGQLLTELKLTIFEDNANKANSFENIRI
jgi:hypothetical protein